MIHPIADDELIITDPFAEDEPGFSLAPDQPPVVMSDIRAADKAAVTLSPPWKWKTGRKTRRKQPKEEADLDFTKICGP